MHESEQREQTVEWSDVRIFLAIAREGSLGAAARVVGQTQTRSAYRETAAVHQDVGGYGVGENTQRTQAELNAGAPQPEQAEGGGGGGGEEGPVAVKQIVNTAPKVGRNDLCPCGSGKKYKKCHGANVA